jgi:hypothetical protein
MFRRLIFPIILLGGLVWFMKRRGARDADREVADSTADPGAST